MCVKLVCKALAGDLSPTGVLDEVGAPGAPTLPEEIIAEKDAGGRKVIVISDVATGK